MTTTFAAIIVAAGSGSRAGGSPKQLRPIAGKPMVRWSAEALLAAGADPMVIAIRPDDHDAMAAALAGLDVIFADGGARRCDSVSSALACVPEGVETVLVHDAARPFVTAAHVSALLAGLEEAEGAIPALPAADTLKRAGADLVEATVPRENLWRAQTPQAFRRAALAEAYAALSPEQEPTDDAEVVERADGQVRIVAGDPMLTKITWPEDFAMAERLAGAARVVVRTGLGLDAHCFTDGDHVMLCGVRIPHTAGLLGHSDADAGLHALTDAVLGAAGLGDIGDHFPPSDPQWRGADSAVFLQAAAGMVTAHGGRILNVDVTLVCERPKVKPHREAMRERVADILALPLDRVSVKATTTEGMGFTGREEGVAAQAVATLEMLA